MAGVAKGIIDIQINTGSSATQLKTLLNQVNSFNAALAKGNLAQGKMFSEYTKDLSKAINSSGVFTSEFVRMNSAVSNLDNTLKRGKGTLGQFFSAAFNRNSAAFASTMELAARRAATLQTQFINTGASAKGMGEALAIRPLDAFSSKAAIAAERQALLNTMFRQGTTHMINFGKNVQWAGRQLMVGFTVPMTVLGTVAGRTFMDIEKQLVNLRKVYGDAFTTPEEVNKNIAQVRQLAEEYTKYGIAVKDTIGMAANAAASGARNGDLIDATRQATRLATLGQMDQNEALKTTIALQSAFRLSGEELADTINFLNMVENQTVVSLQDLSAAIPRVAPVIKGLGGDVRDMSVFLAAMQEGGVSAEQGANALKSGLASLINPTKAATETLGSFGINLDKIISTNRGDLMGTVFAFGEALKGLDDFSKQQALEKVFGKYQYARLGALFENIVRDGSQASQVLQLMEYDVEALKATAEKELGAVENALGTQLIGAVERLKLSLEPIGKIFIEMAIPVVNFLTKIVEKFDGLSEGQKQFAAIAAVIVGVVVPAGTMFLGLLINLLGTLGKITHGFGIFGKALIKGGPVAAVKALTQSTKYLSIEELEAAGAAKQLASSTQIANAAMLEQATSTGAARNAVAGLVAEYRALIAVQQQAAATRPGFGVAGAAGAAAAGGVKTGGIRMRGLRRNKGGEIFMSGGTTVPGVGNTDTVPAMLTPGEFVVNKEATAQNYALLDAINSGNKFNNGGMIPGVQYFNRFMRQRQVQPRRPNVPFGQVEVNANAANARRQEDLQEMAQALRQERPAPPIRPNNPEGQQAAQDNPVVSPMSIGQLVGDSARGNQRAINVLRELREDLASGGATEELISTQGRLISQTPLRRVEGGQPIKVFGTSILDSRGNPAAYDFNNRLRRRLGVGRGEMRGLFRLDREVHGQSQPISPFKHLLDESGIENPQIIDQILRDKAESIVRTFPASTRFRDPDYGNIYVNTLKEANIASDVRERLLSTARAFSNERGTARINSFERYLRASGKLSERSGGRATYIYTASDGTRVRLSAGETRATRLDPSYESIETPAGYSRAHVIAENFNKGGAVGGMQYFGARMPNRVVKGSQIKKFSGEKIADSEGHSSRFRSLAGVYDVNGRKMFVKPFLTLEEAQAELIGNVARRRIAGTATPGSRIVRMDGPDGEIFATTAPMIPGMKSGATLSTKELIKQIPASSMLGDMDATAGNILSTRGGRLLTVDPGASGIKLIRNSKGVFRRATGSEISFGDEATNTGSYTARAITQVTEKTGASKDYVKMLADSIAREGLTKTQFIKMYDDAIESAIARVPSFKLPPTSRIGDRTKLDEAARAAGYKDADEAYSATMLRDLTSIRGLGGDIYSSASRFQGILKANNGTLVPGMGNTDTVPAMLTPGEFVINKEATAKNLPLLQAINDGETRRYGIGDYVNPLGSLTNAQRIKGIRPSESYQQSRSATGYNVFNGMGSAERVAPVQAALKTGPKYILDAYKAAGKQIAGGATSLSKSIVVAGRSIPDYTRMNLQPRAEKRMAPRLAELRDKKVDSDLRRKQKKLYNQSEEGKRARADRISKASSGMAMAGMIPMMASGFVDDPKQSQMLMGAGAAMSILPMLIQFGPILGSLTLAVGAAAAGFLAVKKSLDNTSKAAADFGSNLGGAANRMETVGAATGYGFASTRSAMQDFRFTEKQSAGASEIMPYFDTDEGKKLIKDMKNLSSEQRYEKVASMLTFAIADGMAPEKAEAFGSAIAFALDDALLKSKVVGLIRSGTLQAGSNAMITEIAKRQKATDSSTVADFQKADAEKTKRDGTEPLLTTGEQVALAGAGVGVGAGIVATGAIVASAGALSASFAAMGAALGAPLPVIGSVIGALIGAGVGFAYYNSILKNQQKEVAEASKSFGSSIQTLKELKNAESLLNEERTKGLVTDDQFASSQKQINDMRNVEYDRIKSAIDVGASADAQAQGIKDQLVLSGFEADLAQSVAANTTTDSVANKMFDGQDYKFLDDASKEVVDTVIAATLDGLTPENAATRVGDITDFYANMGEDLVRKAEDGMLTAVELQAEFEKFQISKFATSAVENMPGYDTMSDQQRTDKATAMTDSISGAMDQVEALGVSPTNLVNSLYELADPALLEDITKNSDGVVKFAKVLDALPDGWDLNVGMKYFSGQNEEKDPAAFFKSQQAVIDKIAELMPQGSDAMGMYELLGVTTVEEAETKLKDINTQVDDLFNKVNGNDKQVAIEFSSRGYDMTQEEIDKFNALPDSQQKTYLTSFIMATMQIGGTAPVAPAKTGDVSVWAQKQAQYVKDKAAFDKTFADQLASNQAALAAVGLDQSQVVDPNQSGGGSSGSNKMTKKGAKKWLKDSKKELKALNDYSGAVAKVVDGTNAEAISMIPQDVYMKLSTANRKKAIEEMNKQIDAQKKLNAILEVAGIKENTKDLADQLAATTTLVSSGLNPEIVAMVDMKTYLNLNTAQRQDYINSLESQTDAQKKLAAVLELVDIKKNTRDLQDQVNITKDLVTQGISAEIAGLVDVGIYLNLNTEKRAEYIRELQKELSLTKALEWLTKSTQERTIETLDLEKSGIDIANNALETRIEGMTRETELIQRQINIRNRALDLLSREEEKINKTYDERITALDKVAKANDRLNEQNTSRIGLAAALASGDIAGAATISAEIQVQDAQYRIEDAKAELEKQKQKEVESLAISVNGVMMTRKEIQEEITNLGDDAYKIEENMILIQDQLYANGLRQKVIDDNRLKLEQQVLLIKQKQAIEAIRAQNVSGQALIDLQNLIDAYNSAQAASAAAGIGTPGAASNTSLGAGGGGGAAPIIAAPTPVAPDPIATPAPAPVVATPEPVAATPAAPALPEGHIAGDTLFNTMIDLYKALGSGSKTNFNNIVDMAPGIGFADWIAKRVGGKISDSNLTLVNTKVLDNAKVGNDKGEDVDLYDDRVSFKVFAGGEIPSAMSKYGIVPGVGGMDSVNTSLTPGEFVIRKAMVNKYGLPLLEAINMGAFKMPNMQSPKFNIGGSGGFDSRISDAKNPETMYNNTYNVNVNVAGTDASPDDIARVVMDKISQVTRGNLRSNRY